MGNPFIFEQINDYLKTGTYRTYTLEDRTHAFFEYLRLAAKYSIRFSHIKGQAMRFTKGMRNGSAIRSKITHSKEIDGLVDAIRCGMHASAC